MLAMSAFLLGSFADAGIALAESSITATLIRGKASILRSGSTTWTTLGGELPANFKPSKITAQSVYNPTGTIFIRMTLTFWDAGAKLGDAKYASVNVLQENVWNKTGVVNFTSSTTCTFSGGPNGSFYSEPTLDYDRDLFPYLEYGLDVAYAGITGELSDEVGFIWRLKPPGTGLSGFYSKMSVTPANAFANFPADVPTAVTINDKIKTEDNTRVELKFPDGSIFRIKSGTILTLMTGGINLQVGDAWFNLQKQGTTFQVVTPTAQCGVLGTEFSVSVDGSGNSAVLLYKGTVQVSDTKGASTVTLNAGQKITTDAKGLSKPVALSSNETEDAWEASYANMDSAGGGGCSAVGVTLD